MKQQPSQNAEAKTFLVLDTDTAGPAPVAAMGSQGVAGAAPSPASQAGGGNLQPQVRMEVCGQQTQGPAGH